jgi:hypothetical protein
VCVGGGFPSWRPITPCPTARLQRSVFKISGDRSYSGFKKIVQGFSGKKSKFRKKGGINPYRDWKAAVMVFAVINIFVFAASINMIFKIQKGGIFKAALEDQREIPTVSDAEFQEVVAYFENKRQNFEIARQGHNVQDPSR